MASSIHLTVAMDQLNLNPSASRARPLETFELFSQLAPELRLKIWSYACFPRVLPIYYQATSTTSVARFYQTRVTRTTTAKFISSAAPPPLLSVCHEARAQALSIYVLTFATSTSPGTIYFNPNRDTLYFPRYRQMGYDETLRDLRLLVSQEKDEASSMGPGRKAVLDEVKSIALDYVDVNIKRPWEGYNKSCLIRSFPQLEEILLVVEPKHQGARVQEVSGDEVEGTEIGFGAPRVEPETLVRWWAGFRHSFLMEEKDLEERCKNSGKEYERYTLPVVRSVGKSC